MKKLFVTGLIGAMLLAGCQSKTATGAVAGGVIGAGAGALVKGGSGAAVGAVVGAVAGGVVGAALDAQDRKIMEKSSPRTVERMDRKEPLTVSDVIRLSQGGVSDDTVIQYMQETKATYNISEAQIERLREGGVSRRVINYMVSTGK